MIEERLREWLDSLEGEDIIPAQEAERFLRSVRRSAPDELETWLNLS